MQPTPPQPTPTATDAATMVLVARARAGDREASAELFARCAPRVRGLCAVRMGQRLVDLDDFEDIVQESLLSASSGLPHFRGDSEGRFVAWLTRIVESRLLDAQRQANAAKRGGGVVQRRADLGVTTISTLAGADPTRSPSQAAASDEIDPRLELALLGLGSPLREVVYQKLVLDMTHAEIATELGFASADSSRALFHKALAQLRERLGGPPES